VLGHDDDSARPAYTAAMRHLLYAALFAVVGCGGSAVDSAAPADPSTEPTATEEPAAVADPAAVHGMLLVGIDRTYISHLPMFQSPHDYQLIVEVEFDADVRAKYSADRKNTGELVYTLVPEKFVLPVVIAKVQAGQSVTVDAQIVRGHFERGGSPIIENAKMTLTRVVHFRKLDASTPRPDSFRAICFGSPGEQFIAHYVSGKPDFDQIVTVEGNLPSGTTECSIPGRPDTAELKAGEELSVELDGTTTRAVVGTSIYLERGDLEM